MSVNFPRVLLLRSLFAFTYAACAAFSFAGDCPNVLILLADDQGWGDLSLHGNRNLNTPHLDAIAELGAQFEQFFVCPVCAPTRAEFLTGRYHRRTGVTGVSRGEERMNADEVTVADLFHSAGYATGAFGKWHNGTQPPLHPIHRGFDTFYGFTSGHWSHYFNVPMDRDNRRVRGHGFIADDIANHAIEFLTESRERPFFCYVAFNTPHSPMMVPDRFYVRFADRSLAMKHRDPKREDAAMTKAALALCENLDWNVGRILTSLRDVGAEQKTIVVYFSDNGPNSWRWNGGLKGKKGSIDEGGLKSPLFIRWPDHIAAGTRIRQLAGAIDLLPTLCNLASVKIEGTKPLDGIDLSATLLGASESPPERTLFSVRRQQVSARSQRFRLDADGRLFDMRLDPGQSTDVANRFPEVARRLRQQADLFSQQVLSSREQSESRPFHVGYGSLSMLPARDATATGSIQRSSKAPNNSFFTNWVDVDDVIEWSVDVGQSGQYEFVLWQTCRAEDTGVSIALTAGQQQVSRTIQTAFDPPLYDKSKERVEKSHYHMKDFRPVTLGRLDLTAETTTFTLSVADRPGPRAVDVYALDVHRIDD